MEKAINSCKNCTHPLIIVHNVGKCYNPSCPSCDNKLLRKQWLIGKYIAQIDEIKYFLEEQYSELEQIISDRHGV